MEWLVVLGVCVLLAAVTLSVAAVMAAAAADRGPAVGEGERVATWQAGYSEHDLHVLASLAAAARSELGADRVEVVLEHAGGTGDAVVVTGCQVPPGRLGDRVTRGAGLAGRGLVARHTLVGKPRPRERPGELAVPIRSSDGVVGVVTATAGDPGQPFAPRHVAALEALAAEAGERLGPRAGDGHRDTG